MLIPETRDDMLDAVLLVGDIVGSKDQADKVVAEFEKLEQLVTDRLADVANEDRALVYMTGNDTLSIQTGDMYQDYLISVAGGIKPGADLMGSSATVSPEQITAWNPDYIFIVSGNADTTEDVLANPQLAQVKAVTEGNVFKMPSATQGSWDFPEPRSACTMV